MRSVGRTRRRVAGGVVIGALAVSAVGCGGENRAGADSSDEATIEPPSRTPTWTSSPGFDFGGVPSIVERFIDERDLNGAALVVVDRDDGIVAQGYWGEFGPNRVSLIASSSKMITAGVLLRLHDDGLLDIDAPVADVAGWGAGNPAITPAQLLSNSSGLVGLSDPAYGPYACQFSASGTLQQCASAIFSTPDDDADIVLPDTEFRYGGAQWQVAGAVAEVASGKPWAQLIDDIYVQPCGLETLAYNNHFTQLGVTGFGQYPTSFGADPSRLHGTDNPNIEGGAYIAPPDYAELLLIHLRGGRCGDTQVLSQASLDRMHADRIGPTYGGDAGPGFGYGMGWWVDRASGRISDPGAYGTVPWLDLDDGYGAYLVIEADSETAVELAQELFDPVEQAVHVS